MFKVLFLGGMIAATATTVNAACLSDTVISAAAPLSSYVHNVVRDDGARISLYQKADTSAGTADEMFLEVIRKGECIVSAKFISRKELDENYQIYASWAELTEGTEGEGEGTEEGESSNYSVAEDDIFPFLSLNTETYAIKKIYGGRIAKPDFKRRDKEFAAFKTRITQGMKGGVNFSGEYALTQIGCGASCSFAILSNIRTGEQFEFPIGGEEAGPLSLKFAADSSLLITSHREQNSCVLESLLFNGDEWVTLAKPVIGEADLCYNDIEESIALYKRQSGLPFETSDGSNNRPIAGKLESSEISKDGEAVPRKGNFEDINLSALRDLYETYFSVKSCYQARQGQRDVYISDADMKKVQNEFEKNRVKILSRNQSIDVKEVENAAAKEVMLFAGVLMGSQFRYDRRTRDACRQLLSLFPPDLERTVAREILPPAGTPNIGSGLIIPQDPRFQ